MVNIVAFDLTDKEIDDASHVEPLLEQLDDAPASFMGDGAYDRAHVLDAVLVRNPDVRFIVPPCKGAVLGPTATTVPTQRDLHIRSINKHGRMNWQKTSGYNRRSKVEAAIARYKRVIGDALRSRENSVTPPASGVAVQALIVMLGFWLSACVRMPAVDLPLKKQLASKSLSRATNPPGPSECCLDCFSRRRPNDQETHVTGKTGYFAVWAALVACARA